MAFSTRLLSICVMKSPFSESQIVGILKEADVGMRVADVCRKHCPRLGILWG